MEVILGKSNSPKTDSKRAELIVSIGLDKMLQDLLPREEPISQKAMSQMFALNPEFVSDFVADAIKQGGEQQGQQVSDAKKLWRIFT
jgi:hypothetical protein